MTLALPLALRSLRDVRRIDTAQGVSVERYGAVGDGETDDTDAFQAAASAGFGVRLAAGKTYLVPAFTTNRPVIGSGKSATTIIGDLTLQNCSRHTFGGFRVQGKLTLNNFARNYVYDVQVENEDDDAVLLTSDSSDWGVLWNVFSGLHAAATGEGHAVRFVACKFGLNANTFIGGLWRGGAAGAGLRLESVYDEASAKFWEIENNTFVGVDVSFGQDGIHATGNNIRSNYFSNLYAEGLSGYSVKNEGDYPIYLHGGTVDEVASGDVYYYEGSRAPIGGPFGGSPNLNPNPRLAARSDGSIPGWAIIAGTATQVEDASVHGGSVTRLTVATTGGFTQLRRTFTGLEPGRQYTAIIKVKPRTGSPNVAVTGAGSEAYASARLEKDDYVLRAVTTAADEDGELTVRLRADGSGTEGNYCDLIGLWLGIGTPPRDFEATPSVPLRQAGTQAVTESVSSPQDVVVTYAQEFAATPVLNVTVRSSTTPFSSNFGTVVITAQSATGFTARVFFETEFSGSLHWQAEEATQ